MITHEEMSSMFKLVEVKALSDYRLWVRFDDGVEGEVDLSNLAGQGVFAIWDDYKVFKRVHIDSSGAPSWNDDIDICPDSLYLQVTGKTVEQVFPKIKTTSIDA